MPEYVSELDEQAAETVRVAVDQNLCVPPDTGFRYLTDIENWHEFIPGFIRFAGPGRWREPGDGVTVLARIFGIETELEMRLLELTPGRRVRFVMRRAGVPALHHERTFSPAAGGCCCEFAVSYRPRSGWLGFVDTAALPGVLLANLRLAAAAYSGRLRGPLASREIGGRMVPGRSFELRSRRERMAAWDERRRTL